VEPAADRDVSGDLLFGLLCSFPLFSGAEPSSAIAAGYALSQRILGRIACG